MNVNQLKDIFPGAKFDPVNSDFYVVAQRHLDQLTKPAGSLGALEYIAMRLFAIGNGRMPIRVDPALLFTAAADHGVASRGVSPFPQVITRQMALNYLNGGAAVNALCRVNRLNCKLVDAGCAGGAFAPHPLLVDRRLGDCTGDISSGPAMSRDACVTGLRAGFELSRQAAQNGTACIACGELGIANSTIASALFCALLKLSPQQTVGPGSGAAGEMLEHKRQIVEKALESNRGAVESGDPLAILSALGGYELVILAGIMLGAACQSLPFIVDGFICAAAYAAACAFFPQLPEYAFLSHISAEPGYKAVLQKLEQGHKPLLDLEMRLGEGTGSALCLPILRSAAAVYNEMATFESAGIEAGTK